MGLFKAIFSLAIHRVVHEHTQLVLDQFENDGTERKAAADIFEPFTAPLYSRLPGTCGGYLFSVSIMLRWAFWKRSCFSSLASGAFGMRP